MESLIDVLKSTAIKTKNESSYSSMNLEVALPIMFIIVFLILLLVIYFVKEVLIQKKKSCFTKQSSSTHFAQRNMLNHHLDYNQMRVPVNKLNDSSYQYYEEPRTGYYHVQKLNSFTRNYNNYEKIYAEKFKRMPSNLQMPAVASHAKLNKIEETHSYGLPSVKNLEHLNDLNERNLARIKSKSVNLQNNSKQVRISKIEHSRIRRSYSNSKLDVKKWQSIMAKQKPHFNKCKKWPSKIMTEHELKLFLSQNKKLRLQSEQPNELYRIKSFQNKIPNMTSNNKVADKQTSQQKVNASVRNVNFPLETKNLSFSMKETTLVKLSQKLKEKTSEHLNRIMKDDKNEVTNSFAASKPPSLKSTLKCTRLCKSFTFISNKTNDNLIKTKNKIIESLKQNEKSNISSSDSHKIGSFASFKTSQNNYLKNLNAFKSKGYMSMSSIFEKVSSVSTWKFRVEKDTSNVNRTHGTNDSSTDAANLQANSIMFSNSSSLNSQLTTLMQTNNFGSIMANFGSASIKCTQNASRINRHRTFSDGNGLSESDSSRINMSETKGNNILRNKNLPNESTHSVSFTKLAQIKNRI